MNIHYIQLLYNKMALLRDICTIWTSWIYCLVWLYRREEGGWLAPPPLPQPKQGKQTHLFLIYWRGVGMYGGMPSLSMYSSYSFVLTCPVVVVGGGLPPPPRHLRTTLYVNLQLVLWKRHWRDETATTAILLTKFWFCFYEICDIFMRKYGYDYSYLPKYENCRNVEFRFQFHINDYEECFNLKSA